jgi:hypothetical protein
MSSKLVVVVYDQDLPQFDLMSYCLNKNWQGRKYITVVLQGNIRSEVSSIIENRFTQEWHVDVVSSFPNRNMSGYDLQQLDKILHSLDSTVQDVIVFDCKDFLLKPIAEDYFKYNNNYQITKISELFKEFYPDEYLAMGGSDDKITAILNITPWIWNVGQLDRYWSYVTNKYSDNLDSWDIFYPRSEIASYYYHTQSIDPSPLIKFSGELFMPSGGIWDNDSFNDILQVVENFDIYKSAVWKHHRRITDKDKTSITAMQLQKYHIPIDIIVKWVNDKHNIL